MKTKLLMAVLFIAASFFTTKAQYTKLLDFAGTANGSKPHGSLIYIDTFLYGTTDSGGTYDKGTIFKIKPDATGYTKLFDFTGTNGSNPSGALVFDGAFLYGMTIRGGADTSGVLFKIKTDGTLYATVLDFSSVNGKVPAGPLFFDGTFLYGMTQEGGINDDGFIFKIKPNGTGYFKVMDFNGLNGRHPVDALISDGSFLYGTTFYGGIYSFGTSFKVKPDGTGYAKLYDFTSYTSGMYPMGKLIYEGSFLYGVTQVSGPLIYGTIFKIKPDGTGYTRVFTLPGPPDSGLPNSALISDGTFFYGTTSRGGNNNDGTIFKVKPDGTEYVKLFDFLPVNGSYPQTVPLGSVVADGTFVYGMTPHGGTNNMGVLYKYQYASPPSFTLNVTSTNAGCNSTTSGSAATTVTGGTQPFNYHWSNGDTTAAATGLAVGSYTVTVSDGNGGTVISSPVIVGARRCIGPVTHFPPIQLPGHH